RWLVLRQLESFRERHLVARIKWRHMTTSTLTQEKLLPHRSVRSKSVRVRRRLERVEVQSQRIERFVRHPKSCASRVSAHHLVWPKLRRLSGGDECRIAHDVTDTPVQVCRRVVDIFAVFDADQIGNLRREQRASVPASNAALARGRI